MAFTQEKLHQLYSIERKSYKEIATILNCSTATVYRFIKKWQLPRALYKDLSNQKFGKLTAIKYIKSCRYKIGGKYDIWECKCECGNIIYVSSSNLNKKPIHGCRQCRSQSLSKQFKKYPIPSDLWIRIRNRIKKKGCECDITPKFIYELFLQQNKKCAISGLELVFADTHAKKTDTTASLDRIDSNEGYTKKNVQWVHKTVNSMKNDMTDNEFINWCKIISKFNKIK